MGLMDNGRADGPLEFPCEEAPRRRLGRFHKSARSGDPKCYPFSDDRIAETDLRTGHAERLSKLATEILA